MCKSKGGLTRHTKSKHSGQAAETHAELCQATVASFVESIKVKIREDNLYGSDIDGGLDSVSSTVALYDALLPLYETFCRKKNQDKLLESFYGLIPQSCELLNCNNYKVANLIMIHLPEHLIGFYNTSQTSSQTSDTGISTPPLQLDPAEHGPLSYVAGYVVSKLHHLNKKTKKKGNEELQVLLQNMKCSTEQNQYIAVRTRGGLVTPSNDVVKILEVTEIFFREEINRAKLTLQNIPVDIICNSTLRSPTVKSLWENILMSSGLESSNSTGKLCLENVIKLYVNFVLFHMPETL